MSEGFKKCPFCGRLILESAVTCKHCGENLFAVGNNKSDLVNFSSEGGDVAFLDGLTYMFSDKNIFFKFLGLGIVFFIMILSFLSCVPSPDSVVNPASLLKNVTGNMFLAIFLGTVSCGYMISCIKNISVSSETYNLPSIKLLADFLTGLKMSITVTIFVCPASIVLGLVGMIFIFFGPLGAIAEMIAALIFLSVVPAFIWVFAQRRYWTTFYKWGLVKRLLSTDFTRYIKALTFVFISSLVSWIPFGMLIAALIFVLKTNLLVIGLVYALVCTYMFYVSTYFIAKSISAENVSSL